MSKFMGYLGTFITGGVIGMIAGAAGIAIGVVILGKEHPEYLKNVLEMD